MLMKSFRSCHVMRVMCYMTCFRDASTHACMHACACVHMDSVAIQAVNSSSRLVGLKLGGHNLHAAGASERFSI